jgi:hypothetical protein
MGKIDDSIETLNRKTDGNPILQEYYIGLVTVFATKYGKYFQEKDIQNILSFFLEVGKYQIRANRDEEGVKTYFKTHLIYIKRVFYELFKSFLTINENYPDFYSKINKELGEGNYYKYFLLWGHNCIYGMPKEMSDRILFKKDYLFFWNELYHFIKTNKSQEKIIIDFHMDGSFLVDKKGALVKIKKLEKKEAIKKRGRPQLVNWEILEYFGEQLEKERRKKIFQLSDIWNRINKKYPKINNTTVRNWLRVRMPLLGKKIKSIKELSSKDIKILWEKEIESNSMLKKEKGIK